MASRSFATLVDIRSHLAQNPQSGGAATDANPLILYDLKSNLRDGMAWSVSTNFFILSWFLSALHD